MLMFALQGLRISVLLFFVLYGFAACAERERVTMKPGQIVCGAPPKELGNPSVKSEADIIVPKLGQLLKAQTSFQSIQERVRQELHPKVANWEVIDYRLCLQYASGVLTAEDYRRFTAQVLPVLQEVSPTVTQKTLGNRSPAVSNTDGDVTIGGSGTTSDEIRTTPPSTGSVSSEEPADQIEPSLRQDTKGNDSPAIGNTRGNVTIRSH